MGLARFSFFLGLFELHAADKPPTARLYSSLKEKCPPPAGCLRLDNQ